ncbi:MAG: type I pullulanase [Halanaerobiales bacterium]
MNNIAFKYDDFYTRDDFYYDGNDLGVLVKEGKTSFKIWSPVAEKVSILIFASEENVYPDKMIKLNKEREALWSRVIEKDLSGNYYLFELKYDDKCFRVIDPYARAVGTNSNMGYIVDLGKTNPENWENDKRINLKKPTDAVIYELHVRDFSISPESGMKNRGKYLAFTEEETCNHWGLKTGIDHLIELGVTHVHLLPVFDFATVDDTDKNDYNWGYDPYYYNVPEGSYASNPADESRIIEFKKMVKALHDRGIGVIMDVVYNHTYYTMESPFEKIAPGYFYRFKEEKELANGSGVGNEFATEKKMARKFIVDSLRYWTEEYHIDGFRFDLMKLIDKKTMELIEEELHQIDSSILLYGEPWSALPPQLEKSEQMKKGAQQGMNIAAFNDHFRDAIKGDTEGDRKGYVNGDNGLKAEVKKGIVGGINYSDEIWDFTLNPAESVNYVSSHDNLTLWDKLYKTDGEQTENVRIRMDKMAQAIIFTSQGIPFIQGGEEFLRTKYGHKNSYNAGDKINMFKWERKTKYHETFKYYKGLIEMRKKYPAFRMDSARMVKDNIEFLDGPKNTIIFRLSSPAKFDKRYEFIVIYNPHREWLKVEIPENRWGIIVDDKRAGKSPFNLFDSDNISVAPLSVMILCRNI